MSNKKKYSRRDFLKRTSLYAGMITGGLLINGCYQKKEFSLVIKNGRIIDLLNSSQFTQDIGISGESITKIGNISASSGENVIDATGKYIIPGLSDMHVHFIDPSFSKLFLLNGVTSVRDVGNDLDFILPLRESIVNGKKVGPTIYIAGPIINNRKIPFGASFYTQVVKKPEEAKELVAYLAQRGVDWIKIYITLPQKMVRIVIQEAGQHGLPVAGHLRRVDAEFAARWGIRTIEHTTGIAEALLKDRNFEDAPPLQTISNRVWLHVDRSKYQRLIDLLVKKNVYILANLTVFRSLASSEEELKKNEHIEVVPSHIRSGWEKFLKGWFKKYTEDKESWKITKEKIEEFLLMYKAAGGKVLAGTDTPWPFLVPGYSLHDELALLAKAGFSPLEALQTATINQAAASNLSEKAGTVAEGKVADLLILNKDPLKDIKHTTTADTVIHKGQIFDKNQLFRSLQEQIKSS